MLTQFELNQIKRYNDKMFQRRLYNYQSMQTIMFERDLATSNQYQSYHVVVYNLQDLINQEILNNSGG